MPLAVITGVFSEKLFLALGQDAEVSRLTQTQIRASLPAVFFYGHYDLLKRWLASMRITLAPMVVMVLAVSLYVPLCLLFVKHFEMGILGLAVAQSVDFCLILLFLTAYCRCSALTREIIRLPDRESFAGWAEYLKISLPSTVMICSELWGFQVLTVIAGTMGVAEQASQAMITTIGAVIFMAPLGIQEATTGVIGNCIGANNVPLAKRFFRMILAIDIFVTVLMSASVLFGRFQLIALFIQDESVFEICAPVLCLLSFNFLFDGLQGFF